MSFENCDNSSFKLISDFMPRYDGNTKTLNFYIREVDNILRFIEGTAKHHPAIVCLIKSRLSGAAIDAIAYEESLDSWDAIKRALIRRLGEPRNEIQLMQELTRTRRNKNEDAEAFGKRLRDMLDTLLSVGNHSNKEYYENMVIEQYTNQLDFQISIGVRLARPTTLELAIVAARQEEARLTYNRFNNNFNMSTSQSKVKENHKNFIPFPNSQFKFNNPPMHVNSNFTPKQNNWTPEQRQQWIQSMLPWKNRQPSGNYRPFMNNRGNIPQQQLNPPQKVSDVTMRSTNKPEKPQFAVEELFYTDEPQEQQFNDYSQYTPGEYYDNIPDEQNTYEPVNEEISNQQDFTLGRDPDVKR